MELGLQVASSDVFVRGILSGGGEELGRGDLHGEPGIHFGEPSRNVYYPMDSFNLLIYL